jgi:hypothetical protein
MSNVILIAGTIVEMEVISGMTSTWAEVPRLTEIGAVGEQSEPKEKTTLSDKIKKYDSGMRDAPDKNLKGQYVPEQHVDGQYVDERTKQQAFIKRCRNEEEFNIRVKWPDGEVNGFLFKALGFEWDAGNQEEWKMFTVNGKQNSRVVYELVVAGTPTVAVAATTQLTVTTTPADVATNDGSGNGTITWTSSDPLKATVDQNGLVTGVLAGTTIITAEFRGVVGELEVTVS